MLSVLILALSFFYFCLILSWWWGWKKIPGFISRAPQPKTRITVIIPARNEEQNIANCLGDLMQQTYPASLTQVIVADDHSEDRTAEIVSRIISAGIYAAEIKLLRLQDTSLPGYKKKALKTAIDAASGELIVTTDADCRMGKNWLTTLATYYDQYQPQLISGPVTFFNDPSLFARLQTIEFAGLIGIGAASIANKMHSMCNGANIAYRRSVFYEVDGFSGNENIPSGDDEFLMHKVAEKYPDGVHFIKSEEAIVYTAAKNDLTSFLQQRRRWVSKSRHYSNNRLTLLLILAYLFNLSLPLSLVAGFFNGTWMHIFLLQFLLKAGAEGFFLWNVLGFFRRRDLLLLLLPAQIFHVFYVIFIGISGNTGQYEWKGRSINVKAERS